jgi:hypothetical protein
MLAITGRAAIPEKDQLAVFFQGINDNLGYLDDLSDVIMQKLFFDPDTLQKNVFNSISHKPFLSYPKNTLATS